ncbi:MAG: acyl-CoA thioesterase [Sporichthyaceae bacterium]
MRHLSTQQVRWGDQDAYQHVNNVAYAAYFQEARAELLAAAGVRASVDARGGTFVIARLRVEYVRSLVFRPAPVIVTTWIVDIAASRITLRSRLDDPDVDPEDSAPVPYARALSVLVPFDFDAGRPRRVTGEEREHLSMFLEPEAAPD